MKKLLSIALLVVFAGLTATAQTATKTTKKTKANVTGFVKDSEDGEALVRATIQIMSEDTTKMVAGGVTNTLGGYTIKNVEEGTYIVKISYLGYHNFTRKITVRNAETIHNVGTTLLIPNTILIEGAVVTATLPQMEVKEDTLIFNADAFKVPEGSVLEDLVKKLPGAEVSSDGTIKINGKTISRILVNGKEFFSNDKDMAMKNIPTEIVDKIKTYDRASDQERLSGIADGNEETVIDLTVKKGMNRGWFGNFDLGYGTEDQYSNRINLNRFIDDNFQASIIGNVNSNGGGGMGMGRGGGGGGGKRRSGQVGINAVASKDRKYEIGGNIRYNASKSENTSKSSSENYRVDNVTGNKVTTYSNRLSDSRSHNDNANAEFRIELQLDSLTTFLIRPVLGFGSSFSASGGNNNQFNADPYSIAGIENEFEQDAMIPNTIRINSNKSSSLSFSDNKQVSANMTLSRRFATRNRNLTFNGSFNYNTSDGSNFNVSDAHYFQVKSHVTGLDSVRPQFRYRLSPNTTRSFSAGISYSEPIATNLILQTSYSFSYNYRKNMSDTYDLINKYVKDNMGNFIYDSRTTFNPITAQPTTEWYKRQVYTPWAEQWAIIGDSLLANLGMLPDWYLNGDQELYLSDDLTNHNKNIDTNHNINIQVRWNSNFITSSIGVQMVPQSQHLEQNYMGVPIDTTRHFFRISPSLQFRYRFNRQNQLNFSYRMNMQQPSITDMINIVDDSNPMNIRMGNPELKNSFSHNFSLGWNNYVTATMQNYSVNASFSMTSNSTSSRTQYDAQTGNSVTMPMNINGNWNTSLSFGFNTPLFANERLMLNTQTQSSYNNRVSYLSRQAKDNNGNAIILGYNEQGRPIYQYDDLKNKTNSLNLSENIRLNYRQDYWDIGISGNINYTHQENKYMEVNSPNTFNFSYGVESSGNFNNGIGYSTNISMSSRRGYASKEANSNELVWNAQVSYRFLKGRAATISLQAYDILNNRKNFNRNITANGRTDTWTQTVNSYLMAHFIYRFNFFGSASGRRELRQQRAARQANMPMAGTPAAMPAGAGMPAGGGRPAGMPGGGRF